VGYKISIQKRSEAAVHQLIKDMGIANGLEGLLVRWGLSIRAIREGKEKY
jgi:hypothetical protein